MADLWGSIIGAAADMWSSSQEKDAAEQAVKDAPNTTQQASMWQNQQNMGNQTWAQQQNQAAMDKAGVGTNTDAFGSSSRTQNADGSWNLNTTLNSSDQQLLDALRGKSATGLSNLDMSGAYNTDSDYAKNFDALNRPALERSQQAQRDSAAAMGVGWGSGKGNDVLQSQLDDEQTRFGLSVQNAGHDAWNADQATLKNNLGLSDSMMSNIKSRQTAAPEWGKYATVNAPTSAIVNKGDINSSLGWATGTDGSASGYTQYQAPSASNGWSGGSLSSAAATAISSWNSQHPDKPIDPNAITNDYELSNLLNDANGFYGGDSFWGNALPGKAYLSGATALANSYNNFTPGQGGAAYYSSGANNMYSNPTTSNGYQTNSSVGPGSGGWSNSSNDSSSNPSSSYGGW